jgi:ComF family protein
MNFSLTNIIKDVINLFYPRICSACSELLVRNEIFLCTQCRYDLPRTHFHKDPDNEVARIFWGRVPVEYATAYFYFQKGGRVQKLLHNLKYKGEKDIGFELGKIMGKELASSPFNQVDVIIPVPLHKRRKLKRGYNQSELIAKGMAEVMGKPLITDVLYRNIANPTQTKKHRYDRWINVEGVFALKNPETIFNKHILLVDDIITTGATLEACASTLCKRANVKISIATVAKA